MRTSAKDMNGNEGTSAFKRTSDVVNPIESVVVERAFPSRLRHSVRKSLNQQPLLCSLSAFLLKPGNETRRSV